MITRTTENIYFIWNNNRNNEIYYLKYVHLIKQKIYILYIFNLYSKFIIFETTNLAFYVLRFNHEQDFQPKSK